MSGAVVSVTPLNISYDDYEALLIGQAQDRQRISKLEQMIEDLTKIVSSVPSSVSSDERCDKILAHLTERKILYTHDIMHLLNLKHNVQAHRIMEQLAEKNSDVVRCGKNQSKKRFVLKK